MKRLIIVFKNKKLNNLPAEKTRKEKKEPNNWGNKSLMCGLS